MATFYAQVFVGRSGSTGHGVVLTSGEAAELAGVLITDITVTYEGATANGSDTTGSFSGPGPLGPGEYFDAVTISRNDETGTGGSMFENLIFQAHGQTPPEYFIVEYDKPTEAGFELFVDPSSLEAWDDGFGNTSVTFFSFGPDTSGYLDMGRVRIWWDGPAEPVANFWTQLVGTSQGL